ncbi:hypothetical protein EJ07DRAFT_150589 [Lizonia empirigonia]|nr:hypothetical protein EJ07DRAFT_150589 [Lizonia empirigonia]
MYRVLQTVWNTAVRTGSYLYNCNIPVDTEDGLIARIQRSHSAPVPSIATSVRSVSPKLGSEGSLPAPSEITSIPETIEPASEEHVEADRHSLTEWHDLVATFPERVNGEQSSLQDDNTEGVDLEDTSPMSRLTATEYLESNTASNIDSSTTSSTQSFATAPGPQTSEVPLSSDPPQVRECVVCEESAPLVDFPSLRALESNGWLQAMCPGDECHNFLTYDMIRTCATPAVFEQYDAFIARSALSSNPNFQWCRAEGCNSGQIQDGSSNTFACVACHAWFCIAHEVPCHFHETCREYDARMQEQKKREDQVGRAEQEEASLQAVEQLTKKCPRETCGSPIEKNGGCNQMTCVLMDYRRKMAGRLVVMVVIILVGRRRLDDLVPVSGDIKHEVIRL